MSTTRSPRRALVGATALAVALGAGTGTALALWDDHEEFGAEIGSGMVGFAVGEPGAADRAVATGPADELAFPLGPGEAETLLETGSVAVGIQVDARADGNKGLRYALDLPHLPTDSIFGNSTVRVHKVPSADCPVTAGGELVATYTPPGRRRRRHLRAGPGRVGRDPGDVHGRRGRVPGGLDGDAVLVRRGHSRGPAGRGHVRQHRHGLRRGRRADLHRRGHVGGARRQRRGPRRRAGAPSRLHPHHDQAGGVRRHDDQDMVPDVADGTGAGGGRGRPRRRRDEG
ncbi:hypothetical protein [Georgenia sp. SUBG003]|uniref:hypothetical protein n=1 Tax=Georgenia sp. SUBG003 TaxID=1497974 RepID=UPI003AB5D479